MAELVRRDGYVRIIMTMESPGADTVAVLRQEGARGIIKKTVHRS